MVGRRLHVVTAVRVRRGDLHDTWGICTRESGQILQGSFSAVSKPNVATKYALESSRRDLHNALLCTILESILVAQFFVKFCEIFVNFGATGPFAVPGGWTSPPHCELRTILPTTKFRQTFSHFWSSIHKSGQRARWRCQVGGRHLPIVSYGQSYSQPYSDTGFSAPTIFSLSSAVFFLLNFCSAEIYTSFLHKKGWDLFVHCEEFASLFQTFSRNDLPGEAALARGRYVFQKK